MTRPPTRLARRMILAIILASSVITLLTTTLQLYVEYRRDVQAIEDYFADVEQGYFETVRQNAWLADTSRLQLALEGITRLPDFRYAAVEGQGIAAVAGEMPAGMRLVRTYPLTYPQRGEVLPIGTFTVAATLDDVVSRLLARVWFVLGANGLKTAIVAVLIYALMGRLVTGPLEKMSAHARRIGAGELGTPLVLADDRSDEIGQLAESLEEMRRQLAESQARLESLVLERTAALEQSRRAQQELTMAASVFDNAQEGIIITDAGGAILSVNRAFAAITGFSAREAIGRTPLLMRSHYHGQGFYQDMWRRILETGRWQGELWNRRKDGEAFLAWETITTIFDDDGQPLHRIAIFSDVTELRRQQEQLRRQTYFDSVTGLGNRAQFMERLAVETAAADRGDGALAVLLLDLDRFKLINDSFGHEQGDRLLKLVAERLSEQLGDGAGLARLGGDEFAVSLAPVGDPAEVSEFAERLRKLLTVPFVIGERDLHVHGSIGFCLYPDDARTGSELLRHAEAAMYQAKQDGGNAVCRFAAGIDAQALDKVELEAGLRRALDNGEFELHYQPKVSMIDGALHGAEALIRWHHPERGLIPPGRFIPVAEDSGLIGEVGEWALREACRQMRRWLEEGRPVRPVAVNLSARQFRDPDLPQRIEDILQECGLEPRWIEAELTESAVMSRGDEAETMLAALRGAGIVIAVDDFGTGYSSLSYLKRLPISTVKIDRSFVVDVGSDPRAQAIVAAVIGMGRSLGLGLVAEGVETEAQARMLTSLGCEVAQGFLYARPMPAADFERWLEARTRAPEPVA